MNQRLIVGLGNPGPRYARTRHNAGFLLLERLVSHYRAEPIQARHNYLLWTTNIEEGETRVFFMKPLTYMNLSGEAVAAFLEDHPLTHDQMMIAYDDVALPLGRLRVRPGGSAGGQKGIRNIMEMLGSPEIPRLRIGIDSAHRAGRPLPDFVLESFEDDELAELSFALDTSVEAVAFWLEAGVGATMARFNNASSSSRKGESDSTVSSNGGA